jgi:hypothetical protein
MRKTTSKHLAKPKLGVMLTRVRCNMQQQLKTRLADKGPQRQHRAHVARLHIAPAAAASLTVPWYGCIGCSSICMQATAAAADDAAVEATAITAATAVGHCNSIDVHGCVVALAA